ncbi:MAG: hypothetical protein HOV94_05360 [Saccharothrix sp.]|nr:hypothetical protein [Saccharothrix sp.]
MTTTSTSPSTGPSTAADDVDLTGLTDAELVARFPVARPRQMISGDDHHQALAVIVTLYRRHRSIRRVAELVGRSYKYVRDVLGDAKEPLSAPGGQPSKPTP